MTAVKSNQNAINSITSDFADSEAPMCLFGMVSDTYILNLAAYTQIERVADMLGAFSSFAERGDKRTEQLHNTLIFASDLLEQALKTVSAIEQ